MQKLRDGSQVAGKVTLCPFRNTFTAPGDEDILGETGVRVSDLDIGELYSSFREFVDQVYQFALCTCVYVSLGLAEKPVEDVCH